MGGSSWVGAMVVLVVGGCAEPALDMSYADRIALGFELQPPAAPGHAPAVFRGRLVGARVDSAPWLFQGELSAYHAGALRRGSVSANLAERAVPLRFWRDARGLWLQPLRWLEPRAVYTLAATGHGVVQRLEIAPDEAPRATRLFPPPGRAKRGSAVLCALQPVGAELPQAVTLEPGAIPARVSPGVFGAPEPSCMTLSVDAVDGSVVAPPELGGLQLDPSPFEPPSALDDEAPGCGAALEVAGACLEVADDRAFITPRQDDALWLMQRPERRVVVARAGERTPLLRGLAAGAMLELRGEAFDSAGAGVPVRLGVVTLPPRRHVVLNEVLANAAGAEPESEWIEVVNDSHRAAELAGLWLEDGGGSFPLPDAVLEPGEIALLVGRGYRRSGLDVAFAEGARVLELPALGARGLSNSGEPLLLVGEEGIVSRFPALPATRAGRSIGRRAVDAADDDPRSFAHHGAPGASPGAPNSFE